mgnify:CR=1 FL=1
MSGCASQLTVVACRVLWCYPETDLLVEIVRKLDAGLDVPVTCKIRLLPSIDDTIALCKALEAAGASMITVHGRTKARLVVCASGS